jgi:hypothetical protein
MSPFLSVLGTGPIPLAAREGPAPSNTSQMSFQYYMHGDYIGFWNMYWDNSGTLSGPLTFTANGVTGLQSLSGEKQTAANQAWRNATADLSSYSGQTGRVVWLYIRNTNNTNNWRADIAFDTFQFTNSSGTTTDIFPTSSSTAFKGQSIGRTYSSLANCVSDWDNGNITLNTISTTYRTNGPWMFEVGLPASAGNSWYVTGPNSGSSDNTSSTYYISCETSNFSNTNMYSYQRYAFFTTTDTFTV